MPITPTTYLSTFRDDMVVFFDNSPDLLCILNADYKIIRVNNAWRKAGYEPGKIDTGTRSFFDLFVDEDMSRLRKVLESGNLSGVTSTSDLSEHWFRMIHGNSSTVLYTRLRGVFSQDDKDYIILFDGTRMIGSVTGMFKHERTYMERYYSLLLMYSFGGIFVVNTVGVITFCSAAITAMLGWSPDEIQGMIFEEMLYGEDREIVTGAMNHLVTFRPGEQARHFARIMVKQGTRPEPYLRAEFLFVDMTRNPVVSGVIVNYRDATRYRE